MKTKVTHIVQVLENNEHIIISYQVDLAKDTVEINLHFPS